MGGYTNKKQRFYNEKYFKSIIGVAKKLYHHMKERSKNNNWEFNLSYDEFVEWLDKTDFEMIYNNWVISGYDNKLKPSIDRVDDYGFYEIGNINVILWYDNWKKGQSSEKNIKAYTKSFTNHNKNKMYFITVCKDEYKETFFGSTEVKNKFPFMLTSKIIDCCNGKAKSHHGYTFYKVKEVVSQ